MTILTTRFNSSVLSFGVYNTDTCDFTIAFRNGRAYHYFDVTIDVFEEIDRAESAGVYYNYNIRGVFDCIEVSMEAAIGLLSEVSYTHFNSSFLNTAQYNRDRQEVTVTMNRGSRYTYRLHQDAWAAWLASESAGAYYNNYIARLADRVN